MCSLKAFFLFVLLVIFFSFFFFEVVIQYAGKYTNFYKITKRIEEVEAPTFTICTGWKESIIKKYNISPMIFSIPPNYETNLPLNYSIRNIYKESTYELNKDFFIAVSDDFSKPVVLEVGMNEINGKKYNVKQNPTNRYGLCYVLMPDQMQMKPFQDTLMIMIFSNKTLENMDINQINVKVSSNDSYNTINEKMTGLKNTMLEQEFVGNGTTLRIEYTEESFEFIKDCDEIGFYKCWAKKITETQDFNCTKKCIPTIYESLMDWTDDKIPRCDTTSEENCMIGTESYKIYMQLKSTCLKVSRCFSMDSR